MENKLLSHIFGVMKKEMFNQQKINQSNKLIYINSPFNGYLSQHNLRKLQQQIEELELEEHHIVMYMLRSNKYLKIIELGDDKLDRNNIIF